MRNRKEQERNVKEEPGARGNPAGLWVVALSAIVLYAAGCGGSSEPEGPQTRTVSQTQEADFTSIQACISASNNQDTCRVYSGTYKERIRFQGKAITVRSSAGAEKTIIDGREGGTVVTFDRGEGDKSVLEGFTITNGLAVSGENTIEHGGGIQLISAGPTIRDCILLANHAEGDGGGIYSFATGSKPYIENVVFQGNTAGGQGGALCAVYGGPDLTNCLFFENEAPVGGAISCRYGVNLVLTNCTFRGNSASAQGSALYLMNATSEWTNSICYFNASSPGSTLVLDLDPQQAGVTSLYLSHVDLQGGTGAVGRTQTCNAQPGLCGLQSDGLLDANPLFVPLSLEEPSENPWEAFYLSEPDTLRPDQVQLGRSPCVNAGNRSAEEAGLDEGTTRTDGLADEGDVDLGFHYAAVTP
jgi:predicted outer membrane repeat protein